MEKKTINYINSKPWYRGLKIIYGIFVAACFFIALISSFEIFLESNVLFDSQFLTFFLKVLYVPWAFFWGWVASKIPKWIFYYVYFGNIKPNLINN